MDLKELKVLLRDKEFREKLDSDPSLILALLEGAVKSLYKEINTEWKEDNTDEKTSAFGVCLFLISKSIEKCNIDIEIVVNEAKRINDNKN